METIRDRIRQGQYRNIVVLSGAGVSTSCGIPDYRSSSGIFSQLGDQLGASHPEILFSRGYLAAHPEIMELPVVKRFREQMFNAEPSLSHQLCQWLHDRGLLRRIYTQNVDGLYQKAGVPEDKVVEFHGSLKRGDMVLYGDAIPQSVMDQVRCDFIENVKQIDLLIVMGTSLQVAPFKYLPNMVGKRCTRVLVNREPLNSLEETGLQPPVKIGKRLVSTQDHWYGPGKWKNQHIFTIETDEWSQFIMTDINRIEGARVLQN